MEYSGLVATSVERPDVGNLVLPNISEYGVRVAPPLWERTMGVRVLLL